MERGKPILAIVRNPLDLYVSFFYFGWWHTHPEDSYDNFELVKEEYKSFPQLSFTDFVILANTRFDDFQLIGHNDLAPDERLGWYSTRFIRYYFRKPTEIYPTINDAYINDNRYYNDMFDVHFLRTHRLNEDLYEYLLRMGFESAEIEFVLRLERARPSEEAARRPSRDWKQYYTPELKGYVLRKERLLFTMFPDLLKGIE